MWIKYISAEIAHYVENEVNSRYYCLCNMSLLIELTTSDSGKKCKNCSRALKKKNQIDFEDLETSWEL